MMDTYKKALETYNTGLFLKLEGSFGRQFVNNFIDSGIIKMIDKPGNKVIDGYGREIQLKKAEIDNDKIDELWMSDPDFMADIEGSN
tara:strand:+ start:769 stop:1029 length:261 start_codon:yes stop_codon:yes gene_type:complete